MGEYEIDDCPVALEYRAGQFRRVQFGGVVIGIKFEDDEVIEMVFELAQGLDFDLHGHVMIGEGT